MTGSSPWRRSVATGTACALNWHSNKRHDRSCRSFERHSDEAMRKRSLRVASSRAVIHDRCFGAPAIGILVQHRPQPVLSAGRKGVIRETHRLDLGVWCKGDLKTE